MGFRYLFRPPVFYIFGIDDVALAIGGSALLGGVLGAAGGHSANDRATTNMWDQMYFNERMSQTQYQRAVDDLKAAGLNPMLAYQQGGAHVAPAGSAGPVQNVGAELGRGVSSAGAAVGVSAAIENTKSQTALNAAQAMKISAEEREASARATMAERLVDSDYSESEIGKARADRTVADLSAQYGIARHEVEIARTFQEAVEAKKRVEYLEGALQDRLRQLKLDVRAQQLEMPYLEAESSKHKSWLGQHLLPWVAPASSAAGAAGKALLFRRLLRD